MAYVARKDDKEFLFVDGKEGEQHDAIVTILGGRIVFDSPDSLHYLVQEGSSIYLVKETIKTSPPSTPAPGQAPPVTSTPSQPLVKASGSETHIVYVKWPTASLREGPGTNFKVIVEVKKGTSLEVKDDKDQWLLVGLEDGTEGWIGKVTTSSESSSSAAVSVFAQMSKSLMGRVDFPSGRGDPFTVSPDSTHLAYVATTGNKWFVVVDGKAGKQYDDIGGYSLAFSPDSTHFGYAASRGNKWFVVLDGKEGKEYDFIAGGLVFSPDGRHLAYVASTGNKNFVVLDEKEGREEYDGIGGYSLAFSPDSTHFGYAASRGNKWFVVVDGKEGKEYDGIGGYSFYFSYKGSVVENKKEIKKDALAPRPIIPSGKMSQRPTTLPIIYVNFARMGNKWLYDALIKDALVFSPDGRHLAYVARTGNKKSFVVVDGKEGKGYDFIAPGSIVFSPDSTHPAYAGRAGNKWLVVVDGKEGKEFDLIAGDSIVFSPDSTHLAYGAKIANKWFVVVDGKEEEKPYDDGMMTTEAAHREEASEAAKVRAGSREPFMYYTVVNGKGKPIFSPDSKHVAYAARTGDKEFVVVGGKKGNQYDGKQYDAIVTILGGRIVFDSPDSLHYLVQEGSSIYLVKETIK
jgi:hypothetical protein